MTLTPLQRCKGLRTAVALSTASRLKQATVIHSCCVPFVFSVQVLIPNQFVPDQLKCARPKSLSLADSEVRSRGGGGILTGTRPPCAPGEEESQNNSREKLSRKHNNLPLSGKTGVKFGTGWGGTRPAHPESAGAHTCSKEHPRYFDHVCAKPYAQMNSTHQTAKHIKSFSKKK